MKLYDGGIVILMVLTLLAVGFHRETKVAVEKLVQVGIEEQVKEKCLVK